MHFLSRFSRFVECHILDIADTAPIRKAVTSPDDEDLWNDIETEWDAKWQDFRSSQQAEQYLRSLRMVRSDICGNINIISGFLTGYQFFLSVQHRGSPERLDDALHQRPL